MTPSQAHADEQLATAIRDHAAAYEIVDSSAELLDSYGVVACWAPVDDNGTHTYTMHFHSPGIPAHVAIGLFTYGAQRAADPDTEEGDEE